MSLRESSMMTHSTTRQYFSATTTISLIFIITIYSCAISLVEGRHDVTPFGSSSRSRTAAFLYRSHGCQQLSPPILRQLGNDHHHHNIRQPFKFSRTNRHVAKSISSRSSSTSSVIPSLSPTPPPTKKSFQHPPLIHIFNPQRPHHLIFSEIKNQTSVYFPLTSPRPIEFWNSLLSKISHTHHPLSGHYAHFILTYLCSDKSRNDKFLPSPDLVTYNIVLAAYAQQGEVERAMELLNEMIQQQPQPTVEVIATNSTSSQKQQQRRRRRLPAYRHPPPDIVSFNAVLSGYAKQGNVSICHSLLNQTLALGITDVVTFNTVLLSHVRSPSSSVDDADTPLALLHQLERHESLHPDIISYATAIDAISGRHGHYQNFGSLSHRRSSSSLTEDDRRQMTKRATLAESLVKRVHDRHLKNNKNVRPNVRLFNAVLASWASLASLDDDVVVVSSFSQNKAAKRAADLLNFMEELSFNNERDYYGNVTPDVYSYNAVLNAWARAGDLGQMEGLLDKMEKRGVVDLVSYNTCLNAYAKAREVEKAEALFHRFTSNTTHIIPDIWSYTALMDTYAKTASSNPTSLTKAEQLLSSLLSSQTTTPTITFYNSYLNVMAKSHHLPDASHRIHSFLSTITPNARSYAILLETLSRDASFDAAALPRAMALLSEMESPSSKIKPTVHAYTSLLATIGRSRSLSDLSDNKATLAQSVIRHMTVEPNVCAYNAALNACAYAVDAREMMMNDYDEKGEMTRSDVSFRVACELFDEMRRGGRSVVEGESEGKRAVVRPNHVTYGTFLKICGRLMPDDDDDDDDDVTSPEGDDDNDKSSSKKQQQRGNKEKRNIIEAVFRKACVDGMVGDFVLRMLRESAPADLYGELLRGVASGGVGSSRSDDDDDDDDRVRRGSGGTGGVTTGGGGSRERWWKSSTTMMTMEGREDGRVVTPDDLPRKWTRNVRERDEGGGGWRRGQEGNRLW